MNQSNLVIKQQKSHFWYIGMGFLLFMVVVGAYSLGHYFAINNLSETQSTLIETQQSLSKIQQRLQKASESLVMQQQSSQVDHLSNQELVNHVKSMQQIQNDLQAELTFYRKIMAPERDKEGLAIDSLIISRSDSAEEFHFKVTLIQAGKQRQFLKGKVNLSLVGLLNGKNTEYDFRELGTFKAKHFQFQFKYFKNIQGFIRLPVGFDVSKIIVSAKTTGRQKNQKVEKQIVWQPEERQNYVR